VLAVGDLWLSWAPTSLSDVTPASLRFLDLIKPRPELVVLGCGSSIGRVSPALEAALKEREIAIEALDTVNAVATFNILNQEGRAVVGALLPAGSDPLG
jgi:NADH dehydrogenase [ubiquinone] 1 alpha subcomplex assembly factor 3